MCKFVIILFYISLNTCFGSFRGLNLNRKDFQVMKIQFLYNTPHNNMDLDTRQSWFSTELYRVILGK